MIISKSCRLTGALLTFSVVLSLSGCGYCRVGGLGGTGRGVPRSRYEPYLGTYRGVLQREGGENATVTLELSYGKRGFLSSGDADLSVVSASGARYTVIGHWLPKPNNTLQANVGSNPMFGIMFVQNERGQLVAIATGYIRIVGRYPAEIMFSRYGPFDGLVLVKQ